MKFQENRPSRKYECGFEIKRVISDCGRVELDPDEQVTFTTPSGAEYDVARKNFGFYATPSLNKRLVTFGLRAVLVRNRDDHFYVLLVERGKEELYEKYRIEEKMETVAWLDDAETLGDISRMFQKRPKGDVAI